MIALSDIATVLHGTLQGEDVTVTSVDTDSRRAQPGQLFVALPGEKFDGHDFLSQVATQGAVAALVSRPVDSPLPTVLVKDTRLALGQLASWWRQQWALPLIAVTGSNGKTTTKEMIADILQVHSGRADAVLATAGNFNNDIGMPLTLLRLRPTHRHAVIEMGMNHLGEIDYLTRLACPDVAVINNAGTAHIGELGSRENIAKAKGEIFAGLRSDGVAVINADSAFADYWRGLNTARRVVTFGLDANADVRGVMLDAASSFTLHYQHQAVQVTLAVPGVHNVMNALAAAATSLAAGVPLADVGLGLQQFAGVNGRLQKKTAANGAVVIDDTYNANPDSMRAALEVLKNAGQNTLFVMGDMGELGADAEDMHAQIGRYAKTCGVNKLYALGKFTQAAVQAFGQPAQHFATLETLLAALQAEMQADDVVLVKGSRFMQMERVVNALVALQTTDIGAE
ncbi:UDP-N-acetylmuramoyl-tripeptide--D-alanyl-D-alanine ligase [Methylophilus medardicus]|uniref:UDP-N-acetylmuramoyl-tripeptide--D-alanyl-D-alanine ligase n=1 Tax=Methylophilus medardicus TaxID=2588534 RepID=A0A5B8CUF2_9PROT|nr:UDP-N-acetylmuramoyl-tripeptide--D-alanyl-D-alanine ligase [Methylophilus medardicus]QDC44944.1 UDP-N-acetylmuramoyl-tripeptide--D-alanyl-D-alanine ligase [Methylophilus medardicus]QDC49951.1 UDP-N-acetylmuramoyl-tripeptide--D-alanyl-D-alanine ligase [Methylophilus medardicus]QDC53656.1 UDP-N-acetylmuramoyl-tripeptide--D-alanyl-D-alanine ligase [Methylophilus medardicus]